MKKLSQQEVVTVQNCRPVFKKYSYKLHMVVEARRDELVMESNGVNLSRLHKGDDVGLIQQTLMSIRDLEALVG